jgi:hypothetical protein
MTEDVFCKKIDKNEGELENICRSLGNREAALLSRTALIKITSGGENRRKGSEIFRGFSLQITKRLSAKLR